jgi:hypothetical protein
MNTYSDAVVEADPRRLSKVAVIRLGAPYTEVPLKGYQTLANHMLNFI